jgi:hypothetical protein
MIYLIITTCILNRYGNKNAVHRKKTYMESIRQTLLLLPKEIQPIIVENNGKRSTYLDSFNVPILYTMNNMRKYHHKGFNELDDIKDVITQYNIMDEDIVIKLTGRYQILNDVFFKTVIEKCDKYEAFVKFYNVCTFKFMENDCVLGLFAIKCKYMKQFNYIDPKKKSHEVEFATFVRNLNINVMEIETLNLRCCFATENLRMLDV